jgi:hypothetical protein
MTTKPGTERFRDEKRKTGGPRMHGRKWHDHAEPRTIQPEELAAPDAATEVESSGQRTGMGRDHVATGTPRNSRRRRSSPR